VDLSLILPRSLRIPVLLSGLAFVIALGCNGPSVPVPVDINMEAKSCVDGALSMSFDIVASNSLFPATYQYGSSNVIPVPSISGSATSFHVVAGLDTVETGEAVSMSFSSSAFPNTSTSIQNIQFYTVPVSQVGPPACPPEHGPVIGTSDGPGIGIHLEISNSSPDPTTRSRTVLDTRISRGPARAAILAPMWTARPATSSGWTSISPV